MYKPWFLVLIAAIIILCTTMAVMVGAAYGHDAIASREQPRGWTYDTSCCNLMDCREVPAEWVDVTKEGYVITPTNEAIPFSDQRLKWSKDERYHWCSTAGKDDGKTICLYRPRGLF